MKILRVLEIIFQVLTVCGAIYVFYTGGRANAGIAVIPLICFYLTYKKIHAIKKNRQQ